VYDVTLEEPEFCLIDGETYTLELIYAPVPTSNKLWTDNANGTGNLLGFAAESLSATANAEPALPVGAGAGKDVTFDAEGNLWSMGGTLAEPHLMRFSSGALGAGGDKMPDRGINLDGVMCIPAMRAFAFDPSGSLWVSTCGGQLFALSPVQLEESGDVSTPAAITGLVDNGDLAFDTLGNLWVIDEGKVLRFDVERLDEPTMPPDLAVTVRDENDTADLTASNLAFDAAGNLWIIDFGGNLVAQLAAAELAGTGTRAVACSVVVAIGVSALLERPAFDESLGLWLALDQGRFGRLAPGQLLISSSPGAPTIPDILITSTAIGNANRMAFYPAAASLPLYHRFR
jgi:streptogramin lyase